MSMRQIVLSLPDSLTTEAIGTLEEASMLVFRALRQGTPPPKSESAGAIEYDSWTPGAVEYDSWLAPHR